MESPERPIKRRTHVRCKLCGFVFPGGWFRLPHVPNSAMLLHHLGHDHLAEAKPYLKRMETEEIDEVIMELFERVDDLA
jgi:hypothetical protein